LGVDLAVPRRPEIPNGGAEPLSKVVTRQRPSGKQAKDRVAKTGCHGAMLSHYVNIDITSLRSARRACRRPHRRVLEQWNADASEIDILHDSTGITSSLRHCGTGGRWLLPSFREPARDGAVQRRQAPGLRSRPVVACRRALQRE